MKGMISINHLNSVINDLLHGPAFLMLEINLIFNEFIKYIIPSNQNYPTYLPYAQLYG